MEVYEALMFFKSRQFVQQIPRTDLITKDVQKIIDNARETIVIAAFQTHIVGQIKKLEDIKEVLSGKLGYGVRGHDQICVGEIAS